MSQDEVDGGEDALRDALERIRREASAAIADGKRILVLSDRDSDHRYAPIPALLLVSAVHHHLVATRERTQAALVVECGDELAQVWPRRSGRREPHALSVPAVVSRELNAGVAKACRNRACVSETQGP